MYAQHERFADGAVFARFARDAGYDGIEISHSTGAAQVRQIRDARELPVVSVHQPAPLAKHSDGRMNAALNLASTDDTERAAALEHALLSLATAAGLGASHLVVHLGEVGERPLSQERELWRMFDAGQASSGQFAAIREEAVSARSVAAEPYLAAARKSLESLVAAAGPHGVVIGLENRLSYHQIPLPDECAWLLDGFTSEQAGYWHDVGHAEVLARLGLVDLGDWFGKLGDVCVGAHIHDVTGLIDHRAPGAGDVEWGYLAAGLAHLDWLTLEINQHQPDEQVHATPKYLRDVGLA
jgi:sugar phosphate isomerase/epimerase